MVSSLRVGRGGRSAPSDDSTVNSRGSQKCAPAGSTDSVAVAADCCDCDTIAACGSKLEDTGDGDGDSEGHELLVDSRSDVWLAVRDGGWIKTVLVSIYSLDRASVVERRTDPES